MEIKAALAHARRNQEAQFAKDWQDRLKQLKAEEVTTQLVFWCCMYRWAHCLHTAYIGLGSSSLWLLLWSVARLHGLLSAGISRYNNHHELY